MMTRLALKIDLFEREVGFAVVADIAADGGACFTRARPGWA